VIETALLIYVHILLMVFWIGADIGVFISGFFFLNSSLSIAQRSTAIELGLVIDRLPRFCFILMLPVGLSLAWRGGWLPPITHGVAIIWALSLIWLIAAIIGMFWPKSSAARPAHGVERLFQLGAAAALIICAAILWKQGLAPLWLIGKLLLYVITCLAIIPLERTFGPALATFANIAANGSDTESERKLRTHMTWTYVWVLAIYVAVLGAAFLGVAKPG
jgi:hypothetical protein